MQRMIEKTSVASWLEMAGAFDEKAKNAGLAASIAHYVSAPRRQRVSVNLNKLDSLTKAGENIVVPGKLLGVGRVSKKISVCAVEYSGRTREKLAQAGCEVVEFREMMKRQGVRLIV